MSFRCQSRYVLLTYAQCGDLDPHAIVTLLSGMGAECIIGREEHADEGIHLHAFVDFGKRPDIRDQRFADVEGRHPNVQPISRTPAKGWDYAVKDGDVVAGGLERPNGDPFSKAGCVWTKLVMATSVTEFWELVRELAPRALLTNFTSLRAYAEWNFRPDRVAYSTPSNVSFDLSGVPELDEWVHTNLFGDRVGKTLWARSLGKHVYFGGLFNLGELDDTNDVDYAVFDDMQGGFDFFHGYKFWLGAQAEFTVTDKYKGKRHIKWGKPSIWLCNLCPAAEKVDWEWIEGNCTVVSLNEPIFRASTE
nr:Rep protein [finch CRESS-DNA virus]